jgi:hypothetical protein
MMNGSPPEPDFRERIMVDKFGAVVAGSLMLMLVNSATVTLAQTASSPQEPTLSVTESDNAMDLNLAWEISWAWIRGQDFNAALTFQIKGEALIQRDPQRARHYFEAAEHEVTVLRPNP